MIRHQIVCEEKKEGDGGGGGTVITGKQETKLWHDGLPAELTSVPFVKEAKDLPAFVKNAIETKKLVGADVIKRPSANASQEELDKYYEALGRPKESKEYVSSDDVKFDEGISLDNAVLDDAKKLFHKAALTKKQGQEILDWYMKTANVASKKIAENHKLQKEQNIVAIRQKYGDEAQGMIDVARALVKKYGSDEFATFLEKTGLGDDPRMVDVMVKIGKEMLDDSPTGRGVRVLLQDSTRAQEEIKVMAADQNFQKILGDRSAPGHKEALDRWTNAHAVAYPGKENFFSEGSGTK